MSQKINLEELIKEGIISDEIGKSIEQFYAKKPSTNNNWLIVVFGILGSVLIGMGIILIVAHNWDQLSDGLKTVLALIPMVLGQVIVGYSLWKKKNETLWIESASTFLIFAIGAAIAMLGQIYNLGGDLEGFMITWTLLAIPLVYIANSSMAGILYLAGISYYNVLADYFHRNDTYYFWLLLILIIPFYYLQIRKNKKSNFLFIFHWLMASSLVINLGSIAHHTEELMLVAYFSLFGVFYLLGTSSRLHFENYRINPLTFIASVGTSIMLIILSFEEVSKELFHSSLLRESEGFLLAPEWIATIVLTGIGLVILFKQYKRGELVQFQPFSWMFVLFLFIFPLLLNFEFTFWLINIVTLGTGIITIKNGSEMNHLGKLNFGLLIISTLILCRFVDTDLTFIVRGVLFLAIGISFFTVNYRLLKKRKQNA